MLTKLVTMEVAAAAVVIQILFDTTELCPDPPCPSLIFALLLDLVRLR